ncbi:bud neck involved protein [Vermiconidia calcicola]|uniref:Bud neck involved protein n=1 Tax=Vermiconidia calcicola TaxID=1690605 RepID=A0ACC3NZ28_9PEZI|nr:bud neck involved protein [Vermiconidia calcicola]
MAEVLSPSMQSTSTITMLHPRPSSADAFQGSQQQYNQPQRLGQAPRSMYGQNHSYRGASAPVQPYAFQSTPNLRQDNKTLSAPTTSHGPVGSHRPTASVSTSSSENSSQPSAKDDSVIGSRPASLINLSSQIPDLSLSFDQPVKASPDRYRRPAQKRTDSNNVAARAASPQLGAMNASTTPVGPVTQQIQAAQMQRQASADDMALPKTKESELAKRYRRRSLNQLETQNLTNPAQLQAGAGAQRPGSGNGPSATSTPTTIRPVAVGHDAEGLVPATQNSAPTKMGSVVDKINTGVPAKAEQKMNVPPRGSSEASKRLAAPSPLSRQASDADAQPPQVTASPNKPKTYAAAAQTAVAAPSPAAQQLAAVSDKDLNKGMKSKLRRAFSFGSAQELRKAAGQNHQVAAQQAVQARQQHQQHIDDEMDAEQMEIARRQEAAGIGAGIYSGQGGFTGSTDNLSISSTASSASMMLRKMGRGAKKSARSIKGLFRPKSVIGVPAADGPLEVRSGSIVEPTVAQVSMVTVEAERQNVNVNAHPEEMTGGGTGFPKLERNSIDAANAVTASFDRQRGSADGSDSRRSIVGSDKDRAEVLAAVKKGILKRSGTNSPSGSPIVRPNDAGLPPVPHLTESPQSSRPSTPRDAPQGRSVSAPNPNGDYFNARMGSAKSMPNTPNGSMRNISFSPRIQFHDVWSSTEYDRRGEVATCNRLTPMLAQQIKEELNTFKMEMEVHEQSKPHTHFF